MKILVENIDGMLIIARLNNNNSGLLHCIYYKLVLYCFPMFSFLIYSTRWFYLSLFWKFELSTSLSSFLKRFCSDRSAAINITSHFVTSHFVTALGDTGGVPYDILHPVLEKYVFLHNSLVKNCITYITDV